MNDYDVKMQSEIFFSFPKEVAVDNNTYKAIYKETDGCIQKANKIIETINAKLLKMSLDVGEQTKLRKIYDVLSSVMRETIFAYSISIENYVESYAERQAQLLGELETIYHFKMDDNFCEVNIELEQSTDIRCTLSYLQVKSFSVTRKIIQESKINLADYSLIKENITYKRIINDL